MNSRMMLGGEGGVNRGSPRVLPVEKGAVILEPWDPMIHEKEMKFDLATLKKRVLPVGEPFSRLWLYEGIWRPVAV